MDSEARTKRRRFCDDKQKADENTGHDREEELGCHANSYTIRSLHRTISPPRSRSSDEAAPAHEHRDDRQPSISTIKLPADMRLAQAVQSPFSLTRIRDLPESSNADAVRLTDLLGDPLIKEVWIFNYLHDLDFIMSALDSDVRGAVQVKVIHGSWRREDGQRVRLEEQAKRYSNVEIIIAHMPEMFGTHHSKAFFIIRNDDYAQVVIHTANMVRQDWTNLTQAVWRSPMLPLIVDTIVEPKDPPIGSGSRFKSDLLNYLRFYGSRTKRLTQQLEKYDFWAVRAALVGSVPCKQTIKRSGPGQETMWGWRGLENVLRNVPSNEETAGSGKPQVVVQVSSIATLGPKYKWFSAFLSTLSTSSRVGEGTIHKSESSVRHDGTEAHSKDFLSASRGRSMVEPSDLDHNIIFPTDDEVRRSLDGYGSGAAIHIKIQNPAQQQQLKYLRPYLRHWDGELTEDPQDGAATIETSVGAIKGQAGRGRAAPHIKTYVRFSSARMDRIDWAMLTSANLSRQAWGEMEKDGVPSGEVRISSYELGVVVWPALFDVDNEKEDEAASTTIMVPVFGKDMPEQGEHAARRIVGLRMPYDLPLRPYTDKDMPWCGSSSYKEPDWRGLVWCGTSSGSERVKSTSG